MAAADASLTAGASGATAGAPTDGGAPGDTSRGGGAGGACDDHDCEPPEASCEAGGKRCDGNVAIVCSGDGAELERDCAGNGEVCEDGACTQQICSAGELFCADGKSYRCSERGGQSELVEDCSLGHACDPSSGRCVRKRCAEGQADCASSTSRGICNALGTGFEPGSVEDCAMSNQLCEAGECVPLYCEPYRTFCFGVDVYECDSVGGSYWKTGSCDAYGLGVHCAMHPTEQDVAYCSSVSCAANEVACDGNTVRTCNAQGTDFLPGGNDCGASHTCRAGECLPKTCHGLLSCRNNSVINCLDGGLDYVVLQDCGKKALCAWTESGHVACIPQ
jgi:hypothetical protein